MKNNETKNLVDSMLGPDDERKISCIHCGKEWYEVHYKDGVCPACQDKKLPGRTEIEKKEKRLISIIKLAAIVVTTIILLYIYF